MKEWKNNRLVSALLHKVMNAAREPLIEWVSLKKNEEKSQYIKKRMNDNEETNEGKNVNEGTNE